LQDLGSHSGAENSCLLLCVIVEAGV
jgi:hypothetical protein